jgi:hypothetical protein
LPSQTWYSFVGFWVALVGTLLPVSDVYLLVFNRRTRQSVHDLIAKTFVVTTLPKGSVPPSKFWPYHFAIITLGAITFTCSFLSTRAEIKRSASPWNPTAMDLANKTFDRIRETGKAYPSMLGGTFIDGKRNAASKSYVDVSVRWKRRPASVEAAAAEIATNVLHTIPDAKALDVVEVTIEYGYNIGIARSHFQKKFTHTPTEWQGILVGK